jgi:hypothetical protein
MNATIKGNITKPKFWIEDAKPIPIPFIYLNKKIFLTISSFGMTIVNDGQITAQKIE